ncbi:hypothetical protein BY996DRAFT_8414610 [Phakopsora pachyrhizi]|nr:hypothetical protein BY996DRAFT_8414610 [Phakopsora pachyrhizi]
MASVLDFAKKNLGLAPDPKLHFRATALNQLHSSKHPIPVTDKSYWLTYYSVFDFASKVPTLIPISELCKAIRDRPENVENLLRVLILKLYSLIQSQSTRKILEEREWNSLGGDDGSGPQNVSNISSSLKSQIKSFSLKVPTLIYNGAVEIFGCAFKPKRSQRPYQGDTQLYQGTHQVDTTTLDSMYQLISRIILCLSDPRLFNQEEPKESLRPTPFLLVKTNHAGLSQWDCQLEDGKYNQMDQYSVRTDQPCPDQSLNLRLEPTIKVPSSRSIQTTVFETDLYILIGTNGHQGLLVVLLDSTSCMRQTGLNSEGIFRRPPSSTTLRIVREAYNRGHPVNPTTVFLTFLALLNLNISIKSLNSNSQAGSEDASTKQGLGKAIN